MSHGSEAPWGPAPPPGEDELPYDDGVPMESPRHRQQMSLLIESLESWRDRDDFFVGGNMGVYYSELQARQNDFKAPDVFVVLGVRRRQRRSWVVWLEDGKTPDVVIELLSPSTEANDRGAKMETYARVLKVPEYYLYDVETGKLEGYVLDAPSRSYRPMAAGPEGDLPCRQLGLHLGVRPGQDGDEAGQWLRWVSEAGAVLPSSAEQARAAAEQARAAAEQARALQAKLAAYEEKFGPLS